MDIFDGLCGYSHMSLGTVRQSQYRDYEQFPYGTLEHTNSSCPKDPYSKVQEKCRQAKSEKDQKKVCPFCKEQKKRPLVNYLRKRRNHESICEDEEEAEEAQENGHNH